MNLFDFDYTLWVNESCGPLWKRTTMAEVKRLSSTLKWGRPSSFDGSMLKIAGQNAYRGVGLWAEDCISIIVDFENREEPDPAW
jgi:hypothetical protein